MNQELEQAAKNGNLGEVKRLYENGAECTIKALDYAFAGRHREVVECLHENGKTCTRYAVEWDSPARYGHVEVVEFLKSKYTKTATIRTMTGEEYQIEYLNMKKKYAYNNSSLYKAVKSHLKSLGIEKNFKLIDVSGDISKKDGVPVNNTANLIYIN